MTTKAYDEALARIKAAKRPFEPVPRYLKAADCVRFIRFNRAYNGERIDPYVTLYLDRRSGDMIGFKIKCIKTLVRELRNRGHPQGKPITFGDILDVVGEVAEATELARAQRERARGSNLADVELPDEATA